MIDAGFDYKGYRSSLVVEEVTEFPIDLKACSSGVAVGCLFSEDGNGVADDAQEQVAMYTAAIEAVLHHLNSFEPIAGAGLRVDDPASSAGEKAIYLFTGGKTGRLFLVGPRRV